MTYKRRLHHLLVVLRPVSYWYFVALFAMSGTIAVLALRQNNLTALRLRDKVLQADKDNGDVEAALRELRTYTYGHMNARLSSDTGIYPPIQLKYRYERLVQAEQQRAAAGASQDVYNEAQRDCEARFPQGLYGANRIPCIQQYIDSHGGAQPTQPKPIPDALYKFDFVSPRWSPDLAGWSLVVSGLALVLLILRVATVTWLKSQTD